MFFGPRNNSLTDKVKGTSNPGRSVKDSYAEVGTLCTYIGSTLGKVKEQKIKMQEQDANNPGQNVVDKKVSGASVEDLAKSEEAALKGAVRIEEKAKAIFGNEASVANDATSGLSYKG